MAEVEGLESRLEGYESIVKQLQEQLKLVDKNSKKILNCVKSNSCMLEEVLNLTKESGVSSGFAPVPEIPSPADTLEGLDDVVRSTYVQSLGANLGHGDARGQIRAVMKACMTRDLALRFSVSGLDKRRQSTKLVFKETSCCKLMERLIGNKEGMSRKKLYSEVGVVLKNAVDWDGNRGKRRRNGASVDGLDDSTAE